MKPNLSSAPYSSHSVEDNSLLSYCDNYDIIRPTWNFVAELVASRKINKGSQEMSVVRHPLSQFVYRRQYNRAVFVPGRNDVECMFDRE